MSDLSYDAIIIGAGIGGLVCGCYLAKAGMKVLICEQHSKPGGYCTSFRRQGFTFDAAAHCFGGYRRGGLTHKVFSELGITNKLNIVQSDPSNTVVILNNKISYWSNLEKTIEDFSRIFPKEQTSIKKFINFVMQPVPTSFIKIRNWTFKQLLDEFFTDNKLKSLLAAPLLGLGGLPPNKMSAFVASKLFSEFLLDGGYHPEGGMQQLADVLKLRFEEFGGKIIFSTLIKKSLMKDQQAIGVVTSSGELICGKIIISSCDARSTFLNLIGKEHLPFIFLKQLNKMQPSISNFICYLILDSYFDTLPMIGTTYCFFSHYDLNKAYKMIKWASIEKYGGYMFYIYRERPAILAIVPTPFKNELFWKKNKLNYQHSFIKYIENSFIPDLSQHISYSEAATPFTLYRYTLNYKGASFGWACTISQFALSDFQKPSFLKNLYLCSHWSTQALGISGVTYLGYDTARLILKRFGENK